MWSAWRILKRHGPCRRCGGGGRKPCMADHRSRKDRAPRNLVRISTCSSHAAPIRSGLCSNITRPRSIYARQSECERKTARSAFPWKWWYMLPCPTSAIFCTARGLVPGQLHRSLKVEAPGAPKCKDPTTFPGSFSGIDCISRSKCRREPPQRHLFLRPPIESVQWVTAIGARPGVNSRTLLQADLIARSILLNPVQQIPATTTAIAGTR